MFMSSLRRPKASEKATGVDFVQIFSKLGQNGFTKSYFIKFIKCNLVLARFSIFILSFRVYIRKIGLWVPSGDLISNRGSTHENEQFDINDGNQLRG